MAFPPRRKVSYFYDPEVGNYYYAQGHPMKPHRVRMTHNLLLAYGLLDKMDVLATPRATQREMTRFHSDEYITFLSSITPDALQDNTTSLCRFNVLEDCPVFDGLWEYCQIAAGGSLAGASRLNAGDSNIAINWAGGLHHAKKAEASGFCYINDCVLAILELLKLHARVLYVDIDIHHGDGVEEAFYSTDRVMTASFHKFGDYFPGTGDVTDIGLHRGKHYSANFPLRDGIDDDSYREIFVPVMSRIMEWYQPGAVVLQCGADSLSGDRLGCFNLSLLGHAQCVDFFRRYDIPLLLLGGGGYTIRNVARCWAYETSRVIGATLSDELPYNENYEFYGPEFRLHIVPSNMENHNSSAELQRTKMQIFEYLRHLPHAPSAPMIDTPRISPLVIHRREDDTNTATVPADDDDADADVRKRSRRARHLIDYLGSDDEYDDQYVSSLRYAKRKRKRNNFNRRRFPSAVLSVVEARENHHDAPLKEGKNLPAPAHKGPGAPRISSVSSTEPVKENGSANLRDVGSGLAAWRMAKEDSRQTVSGMSNAKDMKEDGTGAADKDSKRRGPRQRSAPFVPEESESVPIDHRPTRDFDTQMDNAVDLREESRRRLDRDDDYTPTRENRSSGRDMVNDNMSSPTRKHREDAIEDKTPSTFAAKGIEGTNSPVLMRVLDHRQSPLRSQLDGRYNAKGSHQRLGAISEDKKDSDVRGESKQNKSNEQACSSKKATYELANEQDEVVQTSKRNANVHEERKSQGSPKAEKSRKDGEVTKLDDTSRKKDKIRREHSGSGAEQTPAQDAVESKRTDNKVGVDSAVQSDDRPQVKAVIEPKDLRPLQNSDALANNDKMDIDVGSTQSEDGKEGINVNDEEKDVEPSRNRSDSGPGKGKIDGKPSNDREGKDKGENSKEKDKSGGCDSNSNVKESRGNDTERIEFYRRPEAEPLEVDADRGMTFSRGKERPVEKEGRSKSAETGSVAKGAAESKGGEEKARREGDRSERWSGSGWRGKRIAAILDDDKSGSEGEEIKGKRDSGSGDEKDKGEGRDRVGRPSGSGGGR